MAELVTIRCLSDNYAYLVQGGGETALIDAPEAEPILAELGRRGWGLDHILLTHHHPDHVQGVAQIASATGARVTGNAADAARLPRLDRAVSPGDSFALCGDQVQVIDVPGHTVGHVAFHLPGSRLVFTADSLMALGCGRLFEGTAAQMWDSLTRLNALPADTIVCSGHDYCRSNGAFALSVDPGNAALRARLDDTSAGRRPCAPSTLADERDTNPFLRASQLATGLGMAGADPVEVFARLRQMKDQFRG